MKRHLTIYALHLKSVVKNLNTNYVKLLQKFHDLMICVLHLNSVVKNLNKNKWNNCRNSMARHLNICVLHLKSVAKNLNKNKWNYYRNSMRRRLTIYVLHLKLAVKNLNTNYMKLLQKFHDETPSYLCSSSKIGSEKFKWKVHEITTEIPWGDTLRFVFFI
jgi:hypothetical protein